MKKYALPAVMLSLVMLVLCSILYPLLIAAVARLAPGAGKGVVITVNGKPVGYEKIGQRFTEDRYFQGRPSALGYNAAGSGGSNKGPSNPAYLSAVRARIDSFLAHNPGVKKSDIPAELVTASASGLDPDISPAAAKIQVRRVALARKLGEAQLYKLVDAHTRGPLLGLFGPATVNVLQLNIALDSLR